MNGHVFLSADDKESFYDSLILEFGSLRYLDIDDNSDNFMQVKRNQLLL